MDVKAEIIVAKLELHCGSSCTAYLVGGDPFFIQVPHPTKIGNEVLLPSVYALWLLPELLGRFATNGYVLERLQGGADLMLPGVCPPRAGPIAYGVFAEGSTDILKPLPFTSPRT